MRVGRDTNKQQRQVRLLIMQGVIAVIFAGLAFRIYQIQFLQQEDLILQAQENRTDVISSPATRGIILDRNGVELAINVASANVTVTPALLPDDETESNALLEELAGLLGIPLTGDAIIDDRGFIQKSLATLVREAQFRPYSPIIVKSDVDHAIARLIISEQQRFPGIDVDWVNVRSYPTGALTSHIIGYMGPIPSSSADAYEAAGYVLDRDRIGYDGLEFSLQDLLAGSPGLQQVERDVVGEVIRNLGDPIEAVDGLSIRLTLDVDLQRAAQEALLDEIQLLRRDNPDNKIGYDRGVVIAMDPRTGEVLSMVSWPTYDNARFARAIDIDYYLQVSQDPLRPLFNQAINSLYPPGSVFKVITLTGVLEEGIVTADQEIIAPGAIQLENRYYPNDPGRSQEFVCWINQSGGEHGLVNAVESLAWSCDIYYYKVGGGFEDEVPAGLGITGLNKWMELFGLGQETGIELAGEATIELPSPDWKRRVWGENWSTGDTYNSAFGQGYILVTPLQMINALNTIANNGIETRPTLIREVLDTEGRVVAGFEPDLHDMREDIRDYFNERFGTPYTDTLGDTIQIVQEGMRSAVTIEGGTARIAQNEFLPYVPIAGKTGTAEFCDNIANSLDQCDPGNWPAHAWFMAYAPYGNPEISVIAFVYNGNEGSAVALPVATKVMDAYFQLKAQRAIEQQQGNTAP